MTKKSEKDQDEQVPQTREALLKAYPFLKAPPQLDEKSLQEATAMLLRNDRFLAAMDAFAQGHGTFGDLLTRVFTESNRPLDVFDFDQFAEITTRVLNQIKSGQFAISPELKTRFADFYAK